MDYPYIRGEWLPDYAWKAIWKLLHAYIYAHSQISIDKYPRYGVQAISRFQYQCENMTFADQSRYNRIFQQVVHKVGWSEINYIKRFQNDKSLAISVGNIYTEDQFIHTFLDNFHPCVN